MLDNIKTIFSITDLENLTGVSVHTIRIWERRFDLLKPKRTSTNIRFYDTNHLKKLLNIASLYQSGHKISKIASYNEEEVVIQLNQLVKIGNDDYRQSRNSFKIAMFNFDRVLFEKTYSGLETALSFSDIFTFVIIPFLEEIGTFWQTNSINPAHEHFISNLLRQKLFFNIEKNAYKENKSKKLHVLFLPEKEMHELGLLFIHYTLLLHGKNSVYLGQSVQQEHLAEIKKTNQAGINYISYFTINPPEIKIKSYVSAFQKKVLSRKDKLWITGRKAKGNKSTTRVIFFEDVKKLLQEIKQA